MSQSQTPRSTDALGLPLARRYITTHDKATGKPTFETGVAERVDWASTPIGANFSLLYTMREFPVPLSHEADLQQYKRDVADPPKTFMIPGGGLVRYVDYLPNTSSVEEEESKQVWHRTVTLDFGVVIEGEVELVLEGGERRVLGRGDVVVQRGTNHFWRNPSKTGVARVLYVALDAEPVFVGGVKLEESVGELAGL